MVVPGSTPCIACSEIQRMQDDPNWLATVTQLSQLERDLADSVSMLASVSVAVRRILQQIDSQPAEVSAPLDFDSATGAIRTVDLPLANCGCR
jgi:hypothetical protein